MRVAKNDRGWRFLLLAVSLAFATVAVVHAQESSNGPPFLINTYTLGDQRNAAVGVDGSGRFVVVWQSAGSNDTDTDATSIHRRRYSERGEPLDDDQQVNALTTGEQLVPQVASDPQGRFVVVWQSAVSAGTDTDDSSIQARRYDADGNFLDGQFQVNTATKGAQRDPAIASDGDGNFVVAWTSIASPSADGSYGVILAQRFASDGAALGAQFQVSSYTKTGQQDPAVARDSWGDFVVTWRSAKSQGTDTSSASIQGRRFLADGTPLGSDFQVNTYTFSWQRYPAVAVDGSGGFVIAWQGRGDAPSYEKDEIRARRFAADGSPRADDFQVNTIWTYAQSHPKIVSDSSGNFVVLWVSNAWYPPYPASSIQAQRYRNTGEPLGGQFLASTYAFGYPFSPAVASDEDGNFVVAWFRDHATGTELGGEDVQGQLFDGLFRDDFDSGSLSRWSGMLP